MLCAKCGEREATVHFTVIDGSSGNTTKVDFCGECAGGMQVDFSRGVRSGGLQEVLQSGGFMHRSSIKKTLRERAGYPAEAREFVREALEICQSGRRVSGRMLLDALRELALRKFGKQAKASLAKRKIFRTEDFGEILFEMLDTGLLARQIEVSREDFQNGFNFDEAFPEG